MMTNEPYETLVSLCDAFAWAASEEDVYQRVVDVVAECLDADGVYLYLLDATEKQFVRCASHVSVEIEDKSNGIVFVSTGRTNWMIETRKIIVIDFANPHHSDEIPNYIEGSNIRSGIVIPLFSPTGIIGSLALTYKNKISVSENDKFLLSVGRVIGVLIQRVQAQKKDLELQILLERRRLSDEIHDNISQLLSTVSMESDAALMCCDENDIEATRRELERLGEASRNATKILRGEMLSLRAPLDDQINFAKEIVAELDRFSTQWGIQTKSTIDVNDELNISNLTALQMLRILKECLSNVLKHSGASEVQVIVRSNGARVLMIIEDNGCGFDIEKVAPERLGIKIMKERAKSVRGQLSVVSSYRGTSIYVDVPRLG